MAISHADPGQIIDLLSQTTDDSVTQTLIKSDSLEVIRLIFPAGKETAEHKVDGEVTVQCLTGRVMFTARSKTQELAAGQMLYLAGGDLHALKAVEESSVLVAILL